MDKYKLIIESFDEKKVYNCKGEHNEKGFFLEEFNFLILNKEALIIENSIPIKNRIPLKLNKLLSFKYNSLYGEMNLESKLLRYSYDESSLYLEYELYNNSNIIGNYKLELYKKSPLN